MPELQLLAHGEPQWDNKVNAAINRLNDIGDWSDGSQEGIVVTDSRVTLNGESQYSYLDIGGKRLVYLHVVLDVKTDMPNTNASELFSIPESIATQGSLRGTASPDTTWINLSGTNFYVWLHNGISKVSTGDQLFFTAVYLR